VKITPGLLVAAVGCTPERAVLFAPLLDEACRQYEINTPARLSAFLAQVGHESGSFRHTEEIWGPTPAQQSYEGRANLGNSKPGDGYLYRARGLIQTTGRFNYQALRERLRQHGQDAPDFIAAPDLLAEPRWAAWSACDYWGWRGCNALADAQNFEGITVKVNGGLNGQADRLARWAKAKAALANMGTEPTQAPEPEPAPTPAPTPTDIYGQEHSMPIPAIVGALIPAALEMIPRLARHFPGGRVSERNVALATEALDVITKASGATNAQEAVEKMAADPTVRSAATAAVDQWAEMAESGGGGIEGAAKRDAAFVQAADGRWWVLLTSPSFVVGFFGLLPLVYLIVLSIIGVLGPVEWSSDVRASLAGLITGTIIGGLVGYYFGQVTSRNRSTAPVA